MALLNTSQIKQTLELANQTAQLIMTYYNEETEVKLKKDHSPVTQADLAASKRLESELPKISDYPVLSEENVPNHSEWLDWQTYWIIDPIDGTKHFINKTGDFCICIALIHKNRAVFGLIFAPTTQTAWFAQHSDNEAKPRQVFYYQSGVISPLNASTPSQITATISSKKLTEHMQSLLSQLPDYQWYNRGSALKYIDIVNGRANLYPKMWDTCEWDSAAGQCILECMGGHVINFDTGKPLSYGEKPSLLNPHFLAYYGLSDEQLTKLLNQYQRLKPTLLAR